MILVLILARVVRKGLAFLLLLGPACLGAQTTSPASTRWMVGIDRSASRKPQQMRDMRVFIAALVESLSFDDEITLIETFRTNSDSVREWRGNVPQLRRPPTVFTRERLELQTFKDFARMKATSMTDTAGMRKVTSTDIFGLLRRTSDYARSGARKNTVLVLLSDMLNSTSQLDMERRNGIPNAAWIEKQRINGLLPDLRGVCVVAVGAEVGTAQGVALKTFWMRYLEASGARVNADNYRSYLLPRDIRC